MNRGASPFSGISHTEMTFAVRPFGPVRLPLTVIFCPYGPSGPGTASPEDARRSRSSRNRCQASDL